MWEADRSGDVEGDVRIAAARVDRDDAPRSYSARICAHSDGDRGDLAREAFSSPNPFFSRKRRRRDRSVDVIALSPIGVRAIGDEPFISLHEFTHDPQTGIRHRFSGIRHRFLSAVSGAQSGGFARFATRLNPLTPCFVTGKNFLRMRPGAGTELAIRQRFDYPSPLQKSSGSMPRPYCASGSASPQ